MDKDALYYVEEIVTTFCYWLVVCVHFNTFCVLRTVKANEQKKYRTKIYYKETGEFHNQSRFIK